MSCRKTQVQVRAGLSILRLRWPLAAAIWVETGRERAEGAGRDEKRKMTALREGTVSTAGGHQHRCRGKVRREGTRQNARVGGSTRRNGRGTSKLPG